jgi:hypothetical protein
MKRCCARCLLVRALLFILVLGSGVTFAASLKGKVKNHVYYSPVNNFTVPVPPGTFQKWARVNDNFSSDGGPSGLPVGVVSFPDDAGELIGIQYTRMPDGSMLRLQAPDTREEALKTWLHGGAMPFWYLRVSPQSRIVHEAMATFEGMPVLLAVVVVPEASELMDMATHKAMDSRRGLVIFPRGQFVYLLSIEMTTALSFGRGNPQAESDDDWQKFAGKLTGFYKSIVFQ